VDELRQVPLFKGLSEDQLGWISGRGEELRLSAGERIATQGDPPDGFYVILEGETEWRQNVGGNEVHAVTLGEGEIFAELILLMGDPYPTTGHATTDLRLYRLQPDDFWEMLKVCPEVMRGVLRTATERNQIHETVSQQQARLISLGTMAAGLSHELNNPASAARRSVREAREVSRASSARAIELGALPLTPEHREFVGSLPDEVAQRAENAPALDSLDRSDREEEIAGWLEERGIEESWDLSPTLVGAGLDRGWLEDLAGRIPEEALGGVLSWLVFGVRVEELLREVEESSSRISELVGAIKSYTHMDRAPLQEIDVHEGLENTLTILGHKLKKGDVQLVRDYDKGLPSIEAHPGELNQVWSNLIDNAIDAVGGEGEIAVRTTRENGRVVVEISDDGPGIPEEIQGRIFEPFFTTKDVGEGTGLGLDISRRIVVEQHGGDIGVESGPGGTRFRVLLPVEGPNKKEGEHSS
jgi:signal transduction histidine kinase